MNDKKWTTFFELLGEITDLEMPFAEKSKLVKDKANEQGDAAETALEEFTSWDFGY